MKANAHAERHLPGFISLKSPLDCFSVLPMAVPIPSFLNSSPSRTPPIKLPPGEWRYTFAVILPRENSRNFAGALP
jgi:hypothetical protein